MLIKIAKNFSYLITAQIGYKLLSFISIAYVARQMGDAKFGQLSFALYFGFLFFALADMGLNDVYVCEASGNKEKEPHIMAICIGSKIVLSLLTLLLVIASAFLLASGIDSIILILFVGIVMILDSFTLFLRSVFRAREKMGYEAISFTIEGILKFALLILAVTIFRPKLLLVGIAFLVTSASVLLVTIMVCKNKFLLVKPAFNKGEFLKLMDRGLPFAIIGFLSIVSLKIDVIMLSKMASDSVTGWYGAAVKFVESILIIPSALAIALFPVIARLYRSSVKSFFNLYKLSTVSSVIISIPLVFLLYAGSNFFINLIFGKGFTNSVYVVKILSFTIAPVFLKLLLERTALIIGKVDVLLKAYIGGVALKIILNLLFIPIMSYQGAAFTTVFTEVLIVGYILLGIKKFLGTISLKAMDANFSSNLFLLHDER